MYRFIYLTLVLLFGCSQSYVDGAAPENSYRYPGYRCGGIIKYSLTPGGYTVTDAEIVADTCQSDLRAADLNGDVVTFGVDTAQRAMTMTSTNGFFLGNQYVDIPTCNIELFRYGPAPINQGSCTWNSTRIQTANLLAHDTMIFSTVDIRESPTGACGAQPSLCTVEYRANLHK